MEKNINNWRKVSIIFEGKGLKNIEIKPKIVDFTQLPPGTETCNGVKIASMPETLKFGKAART